MEEGVKWPGGDEWFRRRPNTADRFLLDLNRANESIFRRAGVMHIEKSALCTACRTDLLFSYRAERPVTGRFAMIAALAE